MIKNRQTLRNKGRERMPEQRENPKNELYKISITVIIYSNFLFLLFVLLINGRKVI